MPRAASIAAVSVEKISSEKDVSSNAPALLEIRQFAAMQAAT